MNIVQLIENDGGTLKRTALLPVPLFSVRPEKEGQEGIHTPGAEGKSPAHGKSQSATASEAGYDILSRLSVPLREESGQKGAGA